MQFAGSIVIFPSLVTGLDDWRAGEIILLDGGGEGPLQTAGVPRVLACGLEALVAEGTHELDDSQEYADAQNERPDSRYLVPLFETIAGVVGMGAPGLPIMPK